MGTGIILSKNVDFAWVIFGNMSTFGNVEPELLPPLFIFLSNNSVILVNFGNMGSEIKVLVKK